MNQNEFTADENYKLIITIVKKGTASRVVAASKKAGAEGGTILLGRGTASKSVYLDFLGINFDPEKEIILSFVKEEVTDTVLQAITEEGQLNKPGKGIGFVLDIKGLHGIVHLMKNIKSE